MPPILIDKRDLLKLGFISVLTIVLAFAGGFLFGLQQAAMNFEYEANSEFQPLPSPVKDTTLDESVVSRLPEAVRVTEKNKADNTKADNRIAVSTTSGDARLKPVMKQEKQSTKKVVISPVKKLAKSTTAAITPKVEKKKVSKVKKTASEDKKLSTSVVTKNASIDSKRIKYSVQVAVYGSLNNAEKMVNKLQAKNINAYVTDYVSKKNKTRFNVRFGYFKDKKAALKALDNYRLTQKGDGYLVNFSADNIVNLVRTEPENKKQVLRVETIISPVSIKSVESALSQQASTTDIVAGDVVPVQTIKISGDLKK